MEENLTRLGVDRLDLVNLRIIRKPGEDSVADRFEWLAELQAEGLIANLGLSNVTTKHVEEAVRIAPVSIAAARGVSPAQLRLAWSLQQGPNVLAIPGTGSIEHLEENVAAAAITLSAAELAELG